MACSTVVSPALAALSASTSVGLRGGRGGDDLVGERLELGVLGDEVGLGVELDQRAVLGGDQALGGGALGALADVLGALDPQQLDGLVEVAVGLDQRVLQSSIPAPVSSRSRLTSAAV